MDGKSLDVAEDKKKQLKQLFPEVFTEDHIDFEKLKLAMGEDALAGTERYELTWPGKYEAFKEIQKQTTATLIPDREGSVNFDNSENIFIEGENLEVLRVLQKSYYGKIKMIYIDPPYNTGNDHFVYPDDYAERLDEYQKRAGIKNDEGFLNKQDLWKKNTKENGQFHSVWLSMMYPRLYLARNLLREDGVIFVSIDDTECANLRILMDSVFGAENFIVNIVWQKKQSPQNDATYFSSMHDYILVYAKQAKTQKNDPQGWERNLFARSDKQKSRYQNIDDDSRGAWASVDCTSNKTSEQRPNLYYPVVNPITKEEVWPSRQRVWRYEKNKFEKLISENRIWWGEDGSNFPRQKRFLLEVQDGIVPASWWPREFAGDNQGAKREIRNIFSGEDVDFDTPKPTKLLERILQVSTNAKDEDIVLDFFSGSASFAHAVLELNKKDQGNRKFICIQLPEKIDIESSTYKSGYATIADIAKSRITRAISALAKQHDLNPEFFRTTNNSNLGFKSFRLSHSNFKTWRPDIEGEDAVLSQLDAFQDRLEDSSSIEPLIYEILLKSGIPLTVGIEAHTVTHEGKESSFHVIEDARLVLALESFNSSLIEQVKKIAPQTVVTLDSLFEGDDAFMTNTHLQLQEVGIDFKVI